MPGSKLAADLWINEYISEYDIRQHGIEEILYKGQTKYQQVYIVKSGDSGKALVLDGKWQSDTGEEFIYHEPLVHVPCVMHGNPKNILVLGGGEGATVREALKWNTAEKVVMVDIDQEVVEACIEHMPEMQQGCFDDPRTELVFGDALHYLDESEGEWDVIISDLSDPIEEGPSFALFTKEYFEKCKRALKPGGVFVVQAGPVAPAEMHLHVRLNKTVNAVFDHVVSYTTQTASYGSPWSYVIGTDKPVDMCPEPEVVDAVLAKQTTGSFRMFDGVSCLGLLCIGKHIRDAIASETTVYTAANPPKFFGKGVASAD
ncbi:methyltransferase domain-containing protein [Poriferisphaera sp. WC338]|uniref:spermine/spermidine synthase domain-containing protein n=1 Tax=Poriferisphaera sp. WC338 TaxID=3425129 RepID=UPI003D81C290